MPALCEHGLKCGDHDRMLPLVVGRAAPIPPLALDGDLPGIQALAPLLGDAADHITVTIGHQRGQARILDPLSDEERPTARHGVLGDLADIARPGHRRRDLVFKIAVQIGEPLPLLAFGWDRDAASQRLEKIALIEARADLRDRAVAAHGVTERTSLDASRSAAASRLVPRTVWVWANPMVSGPCSGSSCATAMAGSGRTGSAGSWRKRGWLVWLIGTRIRARRWITSLASLTSRVPPSTAS